MIDSKRKPSSAGNVLEVSKKRENVQKKESCCLDQLLDDFSHRRELTLEPFKAFLASIHNPHLTLPPVIHVAGTNGKGSTIAILRVLLESQGLKVHAYTSPHLMSPRERFTIASNQVSEEVLSQALADIYENARQFDLSWFEVLTGLFFKLASSTKADIVLLETGLGGEFDATNVIQDPVACVITPISYDHQALLGGDLKDIARAKAGIIKSRSHVFSHPQHKDVEEVLKNQCTKVAAFFVAGKSYPLKYFDQKQVEILSRACALPGEHQAQNTTVCLAVLDYVWSAQHFAKLRVPELTDALQNIHWPGRLEVVLKNNTQTIYYDVAHNAQAVDQVLSYIKQKNGKKAAVLCVPKSKDLNTILDQLTHQKYFNHVFCYEMNQRDFFSADTILKELSKKNQLASVIHSLNPELFSGYRIGIFLGSHQMASAVYQWKEK